MSEYNSYAVLGAGRVGTVFIRTLLATKPTASIVIFTRSASKSSTLPAEITNSSQVKIVVVDYTSVSSLSFALKEHAVEVVVDTVLMMSAAFHNVVADAAKEAGTVKLFVPSEFGFVTEDAVGPHAVKSAVHKHLKEIGLPYMVVQVSFVRRSSMLRAETNDENLFSAAYSLNSFPSSPKVSLGNSTLLALETSSSRPLLWKK